MLILDVDVGHLAARALVPDGLLRRPMGHSVVGKRIQSPLDFQKNVVMRHSLDAHPRGFERILDAAEQALKLG